jgi:starch phosphorylase
VIDPLLQDGTIQLIFSGKSHPSDGHAKSIISQIYAMSQRFKNSVVFLEDYDMNVAKLMVAGCDVWLNNPQRPLEASGTSGMKAAMNGVLNLSILDGWWPEGCIHGITGWQIGCGYEGQGQNECDLISLYEVLIDDVIPTYYLDKQRWAEMMKRSIHMAVERFSIARVLPEYYNLMYQPMVSQKLLRDLTSVSTDTIAAKTSLVAAVRTSHEALSSGIPGDGANLQQEHRSESPPLL